MGHATPRQEEPSPSEPCGDLEDLTGERLGQGG